MEISISAVGALSEIQWGVNELASSIYVARHIGSLISRKGDSEFFQVLERDFDTKVKAVPPWLEDIQFRRRFTIRGHEFRQIDGAVCMEDVDINQLQGFATLIVLCCRYVTDERGVSYAIESLLAGGLGGIQSGVFKEQALPFATKSLVAQFVRATMDSDKTSAQSQEASKMMSELLIGVNSPWKEHTSKTRSLQYKRMLQFMGVLLTGRTMEEEIKSLSGQASSEHSQGRPKSLPCVFDTMAMDCAFIALAAAANGADVAVVCMCEGNDILVPETGRNCKLLVRLWLRQPPESVSKILRYSEDTNQDREVYPESSAATDEPMPITIFGGQLELAQACCNQFRCTLDETIILKLFQEGFECGKKIRIEIAPQYKDRNTNLSLKFSIDVEKERITPGADQLAKLLERSLPEIGNVARHIARIVDNEFALTRYTDNMISVLKLVLVSVTVGFLDGITRVDTDDRMSYATTASALELSGSLEALLPLLEKQRASIVDLIWAAASLWGGAAYTPWSQNTSDEDIIGMVAPHCNILLSVVRDPLQFVRKGVSGKLLYMCRGSLPIIARNPLSGFITVRRERPELRQAVPEEPRGGSVLRGSGIPESDITLTLEPDVNASSPFQSVFCGWYYGQLTFQISPHVVFTGLLTRGTETSMDRFDASLRFRPLPRKMTRLRGTDTKIRDLGWIEILSLDQYKPDLNGSHDIIVVRAFDRPGWLVALLGLADPEHCVFQRAVEVAWDRTFVQEKDIVVLSG